MAMALKEAERANETKIQASRASAGAIVNGLPQLHLVSPYDEPFTRSETPASWVQSQYDLSVSEAEAASISIAMLRRCAVTATVGR